MTKAFTGIFAALFAASLLAAPTLAAELPDDGLFVRISPPLPTSAEDGEVELIEFFNFSCPACFRSQGPFAKWRRSDMPDNVVLVRRPVVFARTSGLYAQAYYAMEALGREEELFHEFFDAIHKDRRLLNSASRIVEWLAEQGVPEENAEKAMESFSVRTKVRRAERDQERFGVTGTPQFAVAGEFVTGPTMTGSYEELFDVIGELIAYAGEGEQTPESAPE